MSSASEAGLIGLGNMGGAIAERWLACGVALHVHDPDPSVCAHAEALGAVVHPSPRSVADAVPIVAACLPTVAIARSIIEGADGLGGGDRLTHYIEFSTVGPAAAQDMTVLLATHDVRYVDAAVSGGRAPALQGALSIMLAGPPADRETVMPLIALLAGRIFTIGDRPGQAQAMKLVNNILCAANIATSFEALAVGSRLGLDPAIMIDVIQNSSGRSTGLNEPRASAILSRRYDSGPRIGVLHKDVGLALDLAALAGFPATTLPALHGVAQLWNEAADAGMNGSDIAELIRLVEEKAQPL